MAEKVVAYIDGFNLYFGIKTLKSKSLYWLNIQKMVQYLLKPNQEIIHTHYFTSRIKFPIDKAKRQSTFIDALETLDNFSLHYGKYQKSSHSCRVCHSTYPVFNEKMTDINIAVEMMKDAHEDKFDKALLITADSDLVGLVRSIHQLYPKKKVVVLFPPNRRSFHLKEVASGYFEIRKSILKKSIFPNQVKCKSGYVLKRPKKWKQTR